MTEHSADDIALSLDNVGKIYRIYDRPSDRLKQSFMGARKHYFREHIALHPLSLDVYKGQTIGVIGVNGSGKSTLLQLITRTLSPTSGTLRVNGRVSALLELGAGFNPEFSGRDNIYLNASIMGLERAEIADKYDDIVAFSGVPDNMLDQPVSTYSSGMYVRLAFAVAIAVEPDILIVDEALAVGDEGFQRKCFARIKALQETGATILFVSHSARTITDLCDHALMLDAGTLLMQGNPTQVVAQYHKMLFARDDERDAIRRDILMHFGGHDGGAVATVNAPANQSSQPESRVEYPSDGGYISNVRLYDGHKQTANTLISGNEYILEFTFNCTQDTDNIRVSTMIKTMTGVELTGIIAHAPSPSMRAGDVTTLRFLLPCSLVKGDYFINVGVVEETHGGHYRFIHRIVDALHVKILADDTVAHNSEPRGFIDSGITLLTDNASFIAATKS